MNLQTILVVSLIVASASAFSPPSKKLMLENFVRHIVEDNMKIDMKSGHDLIGKDPVKAKRVEFNDLE